jgi:hypothetical protein
VEMLAPYLGSYIRDSCCRIIMTIAGGQVHHVEFCADDAGMIPIDEEKRESYRKWMIILYHNRLCIM